MMIRGITPFLVAIVLNLVFSVQSNAETSDTSSSENRMNEISKTVLKHWNCRPEGKVDVRIEFKINASGDAYDLRLIKGFDNPFAIKAALHSILFSMPFDRKDLVGPGTIPLMGCTITGDCKQPTIQITKIESLPGDQQEAKDALSKISQDKPYTQSMFNYQEPRLTKLCALLYEHPDSIDIRNEITKLGTFVGLDCKLAHDWLSIARSRRNTVPIMRNVEPETETSCKSAVGAYQQSLKLDRNEVTCFELEDAYAKLAAVEVIRKSKADPMLLGSAALLTNNLREATKQFNESVGEGNGDAKQIVTAMRKKIDASETAPMNLNKEQLPGSNRHGWKPVLYWIPTDTELVVTAAPSSIPAKNVSSSDILFGPLVTEQPLHGSIKPEQLANNKLFENCQLAFAMHGARVFGFAGGLGLGQSQSADVIVFADKSRDLANTMMNHLRAKSSYNQVVEETEVLSFEDAPFTFARCPGAGGGNAQYLCRPYPGVLIAANEFSYLRELLFRMRHPSTTRALPENLPEWKLVDENAELLAVRHYDRSFVPFDSAGMYDMVLVLGHPASFKNGPPDTARVNKEVGLVASRKGKTWTIKQLSNNPATLEGLLKSWKHAINYKEGPVESHSAFNGSISNSMLTIEATPDGFSLMSIELLLALGYFVAI